MSFSLIQFPESDPLPTSQSTKKSAILLRENSRGGKSNAWFLNKEFFAHLKNTLAQHTKPKALIYLRNFEIKLSQCVHQSHGALQQKEAKARICPLSNKFGYCPLCTCYCFLGHKHNSLPLGEIQAFISYKLPHSPPKYIKVPWCIL